MIKKHPDKEIVFVDGVRNFRGLGGVKVGDKTFKFGMAYRCAHLNKITLEGMKTLQKLNIQYDFDLRTKVEKAEKADPRIHGIEVCEYDILGAPTAGLSREEAITPREFLRTAAPMPELYVTMLAKCADRFHDAFQQAVYCLLNGKPFLFHCTEGKDRTGILAMLLLGVLGATKEDIMLDYLITNETALRRARRTAFASLILGLRNANKAFAYTVAKAQYMQAAFDYIDSLGGFVAYAKANLGVDDETIEDLKIACLE